MNPPPAAMTAIADFEPHAGRPTARAGLDPWLMLRQTMAAFAVAQRTIAEQSQRIAYLESLSLTDELTGLSNRRGFEIELDRAIALARRQGTRGIVAIIDLDRFKPINDGYGHAAGDAVLLRVAGVLRANVRCTDTVARLSGDEFAALLSPAEPTEGRARVRHIQLAINRSEVEFDDRLIPVRASVGAQVYDGTSQPADLLHEADLAMYDDKRARRPEIVAPVQRFSFARRG
jgi:diguanylate cyclase (GGDEF)-like protein